MRSASMVSMAISRAWGAVGTAVAPPAAAREEILAGQCDVERVTPPVAWVVRTTWTMLGYRRSTSGW